VKFLPKLCIPEIDRVLGEIPKGSVILMEGTTETYVDAVALDIIRRCTVGLKKRAVVYTVNSDVEALASLADSIGFPLKSYRDSGLIHLAKATNIISALRGAGEDVSLRLGEDVYVLIDATAASWETNPTALIEALQAHRRVVPGITLLLCNPGTIRDPVIKELLEEISDFTIKFFSEIESDAISRYLEIRYSRIKVVNFARIYYIVTPRGVEYSLQTQI
jgi:KaiC/GvpD/RAD55 family RecA-like ATPase